jgi:hypothetical protein
MTNYKGLLLGSVAASVLAAGALVTPAQADGSAVFGHKKGKFYAKSKDGNFSILPGFNIQVDYSASITEDSFVAASRADNRRFTVRRGRAAIKGRAGSPNLTYGISFDVTTNTGTTNGIFDTQVNYKFIPEVQVRAGQFKPIGSPVDNGGGSSSWLVDDPNGTTGGGSIAPSREVGMAIHGKVAKVLQYELTVSNGQGFRGATASEESGWSFGIRYEPFGRYGNFVQPDYTAKNKLRMQVHAAVKKVQGVQSGNGEVGTYATTVNAGEANSLYWVGAVGMKYAGLALSGLYQHANMQVGEDVQNENNGRRSYNWMLGASYMVIPKKIGVTAIWSVRDNDVAHSNAGNNNDGSVIDDDTTIARQWGVGAFYLFRGHAHKLHASWDRVNTKVNADETDGGNGIVQSDDTLKLRWQVQF